MIKDSLSVDTILEIFVSGGLFIIGVWYLNRTFLAEYFPGIAATVEADDKLVGNKIVIFLVLALFFGILITHLVDIVIPFIIGSKEYSSKRYKRAKKVGFLFIRLFSWIEEPDPRVVAVQRYLDSSSRREWFLRMVQDWTMTNSEAIREKDEMVKAHQHIVVRLRVLSDGSRKALKEAYDQVSFSGSIFVALLLLIPVSFVSF